MMTGLSMSTNGVGGGGVGRMLGVGGGSGSGATLPSRSVQRDWMASNLSGGASYMPSMAAVSLVVATMILLVAVISKTGMALCLNRNVLVILSLPVSAMRTQMQR
jgi:hypothetical protein